MTVSLADKKINYEEADLPGEIYDDLPAGYTQQQPAQYQIRLTPEAILRKLILGSDEPDPLFWVWARSEYIYLSQESDLQSVRVWKLINDMAYLTEIYQVLKDKPDDEHWVDVYRKSYQRLERIVDTYTQNPHYTRLNIIFSVADTAQALSNELFLEQTRPGTEARIFPEIDAYTGIHEEEDDPVYLKVPDQVLLTNADGELTEVSLVDLQDNLDSWNRDLSDPDHDWYEEGEITSSSLKQWDEQEYRVTPAYYELKRKYKHILDEINRQIDDDPLVRIANQENKAFTIDCAINSVRKSALVKAFTKSLKLDYRDGIPVQDIAALVMELPFELSINGNIDLVIDLFGDDILDTIIEPAGIQNYPEAFWEEDLERLHEENLDQMYAVANNNSPKLSASFTTEVFKAVVEDQLPIKQATSQAYASFREVSPAGSHAYTQGILAGDSPVQAMRKFYEKAHEAGDYTPRDRFYRANDQRVLVKTASSGYTEVRELSWGLAKYKANQGEIYVPKDAPGASKKWLYNKLSQKNWGRRILAKLAE